MTVLPTSAFANFSTVAKYEDQNSTHDNCAQEDPEEWIFTVIPVYILLISVLGIVCNVFVLMVFGLHKKACTVAEIYLSNMAMADLVLVACLPFWAVSASNRFNWPFSASLCRLVNLSINMNALCSIYFLVLISIDRYVALVLPLSHNRMRRPKYAKLGCLLVWSLGLLLSIPTLIYRKVEYDSDRQFSRCYLDYPFTIYLLCEWMLTTFSFIIPIFIISFCTLKIIQALNNRLMDELNIQKREHKATTLVLAVLLAFLICWMPFHLVRLLDLLYNVDVLRGCSLGTILRACRQIFIYLAFFNSVLNPILYGIVGKNFQNKVKELFKQWSGGGTFHHLNITSQSILQLSLRSSNTKEVSRRSARS